MIAIAVEPGLQQYLKQINESPLLSAEEEKALARTIARGAASGELFSKGEISIGERENRVLDALMARDRMVRSNLRLVVNIAKAYGHRGMSLSDLIEEGNLGLLRAVEGFDPDMGVRFSTYASWWIKQGIKRALINTVQPVHIPAYMVELVARWKQVHHELFESLGRAPSVTEIAGLMEVPEKKVRIIRRAVRAFSAPTQSASEESGHSLSEMLADEKGGSPEEAVLNEAEYSQIHELLMDDLDERESTILRLRYGFGDRPPMTLKEIGAKIGLTRERVRQIETGALRKLHKVLSANA